MEKSEKREIRRVEERKGRTGLERRRQERKMEE